MHIVSARRLLQALLDAAAWQVSIFIATAARFDFAIDHVRFGPVAKLGLIAGVTQLVTGTILQLYRGRYVYGSFEEVRGVFASAVVTTCLTFALISSQPVRSVPRSAVFVGGAGALIAMLGVRYLARAIGESRRRPGHEAIPVLVYGAGEAGGELVRSIQRDPRSSYTVTGILDDDPKKRRLRISGVPVMGTGEDLERLAGTTGAVAVIVAIAGADGRLLHTIARRAQAVDLQVKVIPTWAELVHTGVGVTDVRDVSDVDLLGRRPVTMDLTQVSRLLRGKRVLITGAGGSIGSELSRQVHGFGPAALGLLDRDESALHTLQLSMRPAPLHEEATILADIRDRVRIFEVFERFRPEVVFHAAALKHLPILERHPEEALKTNIDGTLNVLEAAERAGVGVFVNISTDKAADPVNVLGYSKRITERMTAAFSLRGESKFVSVRFGNVLASRGSVLPTFAAQIAAGGPVTVTHPDVTRFFMTIPESVHLVLQAAAVGRDGQALVLDMGQPVRIDDVARRMIEASGREIQVVYIGLRVGEKLVESLFGKGESGERTEHPMISHVEVPPLGTEAVERLAKYRDSALVEAMASLCGAEGSTPGIWLHSFPDSRS